MVVRQVTETTVPPVTPLPPRRVENPAFEATVVPDHTASAEKPTERVKKSTSKLGTNTKARSSVRKLTQADLEKLSGMYAYLGMGVMPFNEDAGLTIAKSGDSCAQAWGDLAASNDGVRRAILAMLEGGAWGGVILAHMPIVMSLLPASALSRFGGLLTTANDDDNEDEGQTA